MKTIKIALDWTPNANHIGIFVADILGYFKDAGIQLEVSNPKTDNYQTTPGRKLELGLADFAIAPTETVISFNNKKSHLDAVAVFAVFKEDVSRIVTLQSSGLDAPAKLDGTSYASYQARYEDHIIQKMIRNDGGKGTIKIDYPAKLGIWNTLLEGNADSTWIFDNWEGVEAENKGLRLNKFRLADYGIPYGYSPVFVTTHTLIKENKAVWKKFIQALQKGYLYAKNNPKEATEILEPLVTKYDKENINLLKTVEYSIEAMANGSDLGKMNPDVFSKFLNWLVHEEIENAKILNQNLYTNELFD